MDTVTPCMACAYVTAAHRDGRGPKSLVWRMDRYALYMYAAIRRANTPPRDWRAVSLDRLGAGMNATRVYVVFLKWAAAVQEADKCPRS